MGKSNLKVNFLYNMVYQILLMIMPLLTVPYVSRVIGAEGIGTFSYTRSIAHYFLLIAMLGVNSYGNRSIARVRDDRDKLNETFSSIYTLQLITSTLAVLFYILYLCFVSNSFKLIAAIQLTYLLSAVLDINWLFFGLEEFKITVSRKIIINLVTALSIFIFVRDRNDLWIYSLIMCMGFLVGQSYLWLFARRHVSFVKTSSSSVIQHIKPMLLLFFPVVAISIYRVLDKIMIGSLSSIVEVGLFENAEKMMMVCLGVMSALGTVMLPKMSNLIAHSKIEESRRYLEKSMQMAMFMGCAIAFGLASVATEFTPIFFGKEFVGSGEILIGLSPTVLFISWANVIRMQYLIPNSKDKIYVASVALGALLNITLNALLIGRMGAMGAVIGTFFAEASVAVFQTIAARKDLNILSYLKNSFVFILSGGFMYIIVRIIANQMTSSIVSLLLEMIVGAMVYLSLTMLYFYKTKNETIMGVLSILLAKIRQNRETA